MVSDSCLVIRLLGQRMGSRALLRPLPNARGSLTCRNDLLSEAFCATGVGAATFCIALCHVKQVCVGVGLLPESTWAHLSAWSQRPFNQGRTI